MIDQTVAPAAAPRSHSGRPACCTASGVEAVEIATAKLTWRTNPPIKIWACTACSMTPAVRSCARFTSPDGVEVDRYHPADPPEGVSPPDQDIDLTMELPGDITRFEVPTALLMSGVE